MRWQTQTLHSVLVALVIIAPVVRAQSSSPSTAALDGRPASIPAEYLATPFGWFHPSCVITVSEDDKIDANGNIVRRSDNALVRTPIHCQYPRYDREGTAFPAGGPPPTINNWIVDGEANVGAMDFISANWTVPANPVNVTGQILYFFPGLMPTSPISSNELLQPVLGWNQIGTGPGWTISSWRWSSITGLSMNSPLVAVSTGAQLYGYVWGNNCNMGTGVCQSWQILTSIAGGTQTTLNSDALSEPLLYSLGGVYEGYNINYCNQHSPTQTDDILEYLCENRRECRCHSNLDCQLLESVASVQRCF